MLNIGSCHVALVESTGTSVSQADGFFLREGDDGQGEGEQRQGAEVHAGAAGGRGQALRCSARPGGRGALLAAPPPLPL